MDTPQITIRIEPETLFHVLSHFSRIDAATRRELLEAGFSPMAIENRMQTIGSKFAPEFARSPREILDRLQHDFPEKFRTIHWQDNGRAELSFKLDVPVGCANVVALKDLSEAELATLQLERRNDTIIRSVSVEGNLPPTCECQLILATRHAPRLVTVFAGPWAPPLPEQGASSDFWNEHVFVRTK